MIVYGFCSLESNYKMFKQYIYNIYILIFQLLNSGYFIHQFANTSIIFTNKK